MLNLIKFVNYKINFLYHIELTFENKYNWILAMGFDLALAFMMLGCFDCMLMPGGDGGAGIVANSPPEKKELAQ